MNGSTARQRQIEEFIETNGVTKCPPAYVAPVTGADALDVDVYEDPKGLRKNITAMYNGRARPRRKRLRE